MRVRESESESERERGEGGREGGRERKREKHTDALRHSAGAVPRRRMRCETRGPGGESGRRRQAGAEDCVVWLDRIQAADPAAAG